ncbi:MAG: hypothetical protein J6T60_06725 [Bacteroidales bacterium]|nr:hypothetical protein [Bacteroidales bacterium]
MGISADFGEKDLWISAYFGEKDLWISAYFSEKDLWISAIMLIFVALNQIVAQL